MSLHLAAAPGDYADVVLLPGCPNRARFIAETFLDAPRLVNDVRGALGFTGTWQGRPVSVQTSGMGMPSMAIYAHELLAEYGVRTLIRVGTCGSMQDHVRVGDVVLAQAASTNSAMHRPHFGDDTFAAAADFGLLEAAWRAAKADGVTCHVGTVLTSDTFYDAPDFWRPWAAHGVLAAEMEAAALYAAAARHGAGHGTGHGTADGPRALAILTVSDHVITGDAMSARDREQSTMTMVKLALSAAFDGC